jgi:hypothetical protein
MRPSSRLTATIAVPIRERRRITVRETPTNTRHGSTTVHANFRETQELLREIARVDPDRAAQLFRDWIHALDEECVSGEVRPEIGDEQASADDVRE